jgi:hypothetical protein
MRLIPKMTSSAVTRVLFMILALQMSGALIGCGGAGTEAQRRGVGAACAGDPDCAVGLTCLAFKGGYCGLAPCQNNAGCPAGSACVAHTDGKNYCFLVCTDKSQCNLFRSVNLEANCSSSVTFVDANFTAKACIPPT